MPAVTRRRSLRVRGLPADSEESPRFSRSRSQRRPVVTAEPNESLNLKQEEITSARSPTMESPSPRLWPNGPRRNGVFSLWHPWNWAPLKYMFACLLSLYIGFRITLHLTRPPGHCSPPTMGPPPEREAINLTARYTPFFDALDLFLSPTFNTSQLDTLLVHDHPLDRAYRWHLRADGLPSDPLTPYWIPDGSPEWTRTINGSLTARGHAQLAAERALQEFLVYRVRVAGAVLHRVAHFHRLTRPPGVEGSDSSPLSRWKPLEGDPASYERSFRSEDEAKWHFPNKSDKVVWDVGVATAVEGLGTWVVQPMEKGLGMLEEALDATREFRWLDQRVMAGLMGVREGVGEEVKALCQGWVEGLGRPLQVMIEVLGASSRKPETKTALEERQKREVALILREKAYYADDATELWRFWGRRGNAALEKLMVLSSLPEGNPEPTWRQLYHGWKARRCDAQFVKDHCGYRFMVREIAVMQLFHILMTSLFTMFDESEFDPAKLFAEYTAENPEPLIEYDICCGPEPYWWTKPWPALGVELPAKEFEQGGVSHLDYRGVDE
ncbi:hypothetical protein B0T25DRAFT_139316 [Lasiosphaeria hispida]|uniref:Uncharacterized protein n=1 Tax=Lasiosphaeria hispida TaxID=260671 RepID=A0AAJ0HL04_9PEZI|nr:hypothetical protein B0T25DRAFT_139316 [Lasiosphaeria hispida]